MKLAMLFLTLLLSMTAKNQKFMDDYKDRFLKNYHHYEMPIEAAGLASITSARVLNTDQIRIEYKYEAENESRSGYMLLNETSNHRYEGNWHTTAHNGNSYKGTLHFVFSPNGEAKGKYLYAGNIYSIEIKLKSDDR